MIGFSYSRIKILRELILAGRVSGSGLREEGGAEFLVIMGACCMLARDAGAARSMPSKPGLILTGRVSRTGLQIKFFCASQLRRAREVFLK